MQATLAYFSVHIYRKEESLQRKQEEANIYFISSGHFRASPVISEVHE